MKPLKGILLQLGSNQSSHDKSLSLSSPTNSLPFFAVYTGIKPYSEDDQLSNQLLQGLFFLKGECYSDFSERSMGSMEYRELLFQVDKTKQKISLCMMSLNDSNDSMSVSHRSEPAVCYISFLFLLLCHKEGQGQSVKKFLVHPPTKI